MLISSKFFLEFRLAESNNKLECDPVIVCLKTDPNLALFLGLF